jgi:hypothetical protein
MSRRAELTPEILTVIEREVKRAHFPHVVAQRLGVHRKLWESWMKLGEDAHLRDSDGEPEDKNFIYRELFERINEAEAFAEMELLNMARDQAEQGKAAWSGFLTTLERRFSDRWRKRDAAAGDLSETWEAQVKKALLQTQEPSEPEKLRSVS